MIFLHFWTDFEDFLFKCDDLSSEIDEFFYKFDKYGGQNDETSAIVGEKVGFVQN